MKIFVTGATGFTGSRVVPLLLKSGYAVRCLYRASSDRSALAGLDIEWALGDVSDPQSLTSAMQGTDDLVNVARRKMMRKRQPLIVVVLCGFLACSSPAVQQPKQQSAPQGSVRQMSITGEIGKLDYGYVIRGKTPSSTIFTILNPDPAILDPYCRK